MPIEAVRYPSNNSRSGFMGEQPRYRRATVRSLVPRAPLFAFAATVLLGGCGFGLEASDFGENPVVTRALAHCRTVPVGDVYEKVRLHTANLSCRDAVEIFESGRAESEETGRKERFEVLGEVGHGPNWFCARLPPSKHPVFERCHRKGHYFTIERVKFGPGR
jgi:hypothetical protein